MVLEFRGLGFRVRAMRFWSLRVFQSLELRTAGLQEKTLNRPKQWDGA